MDWMERLFRDEAEWKDKRAGLGVTFVSIVTPLSLSVQIPEPCLPFLKAAILLASLGTFLSILSRRWRSCLDREALEGRKGRMLQFLEKVRSAIYRWLLRRSSTVSSWCLSLALVSLIVAILVR